MVAKSGNAALRYLLPSTTAVVVSFVICMKISCKYLSNRIHIILAVIIFGLLAKHAISDLKSHEQRIVSQNRLKNELSYRLNAVGFKPGYHTIVYTWRLPAPSYALRCNLRKEFYSDMEKLYPNEGHWSPWMEAISLPHNSNKWDYAVVDRKYIDKFPAKSMKIVSAVSDYLIIISD